jgi:hypothetical protein
MVMDKGPFGCLDTAGPHHFLRSVTADEQGMAMLRMPPGITPGEHQVVVVIDETMKPSAPLVFSSHDVGPWPKGFTVRREEIYGGDGR